MKLTTPIGEFSCHFYQPDCLERFDRDRAAYRLRQELAKPIKARSEAWVRQLKRDLAVLEIDLADARHRVVASLHRGPCTARTEDVPCVADSMAVAEISRPAGRPVRLEAMRTQALFKAMLRLGLSKAERRGLWLSYFAQINGPLPRRWVAVILRCPDGHRQRLSWLEDGPGKDAREISVPGFCGERLEDGRSCELPPDRSKDRPLFTVTLPEGKAAKRLAADQRKPVGTSGDDVPY